MFDPKSSLSGQDSARGYIAIFGKERWLLIGLFAIACAVSVFLAAIALWPERVVQLQPVAQVGAIVVLLCAGVLLEIAFSMSRKLVGLQGRQRQADQQAWTDPLTGALTRSRFLAAYEKALATHRDKGSVALVFIDVDHFKQINDSHGHPAGDRVLEFCVRAAKTAFHNATVGRLGGDEFAVFLSHEEEISDSYMGRACEAFLTELRDGVHFGNRRFGLTTSMGIAMAPRDDVNMSTLMSYADMALYQSKRNGRARWTIFARDMLGDARYERFLERELRAAILLKQLAVHYQPIVDEDGEPRFLEALVRWDHPVRGRIDPADFIPVAEKSNLIHELGLYVLRQVCRDTGVLPEVPVTVNVSPLQFRFGDLKRDYIDVLGECSVNPYRIVLEITESSSLETSPSFLGRIEELRKAGFRIALDDFGLGYSEFNHLRTLPFDIIKIDKSFIQNLGRDRVTDIFVNAVVQIAEHLDRRVIAEGIESSGDRTRALVAGCKLFQGYHILRPSMAEEVTKAFGEAAIANKIA